MKDDGTVLVGMEDYLEENFVAFGEDIICKTPTPATTNLFKVNESKLLNEDKSENFHHIVAKLLYVSKRARLDLCTLIDFCVPG